MTETAWWQRRLGARSQYVAEQDGEVVGLAGGIRNEDGSAQLVSMWVDPRYRRHSIGTLLVATVADWARASGYPQLFLWVTAVNGGAERLYERCGFARTGKAKDARPGELEYEMVLKL